MGDFNKSYKITVIGNEGSLNPGNHEAFTYRGIDQGQNPNWSGWPLVHSVYEANKSHGIAYVNKLLAENTDLQTSIYGFYKVNYWDDLLLDQVNDQQVCNICFDDSVNPCEITVQKVMQIAANTCNCKPPLVVDGVIGKNSITAINSLSGQMYYNAIVAIRKFHYEHEVVNHPTQRIWLKNWLSRLVPYMA